MPRLIQDGQVPGGGGGGSVTGTISVRAPFVQDWTTGTGGQPAAGPAAGTKGNFDTLDFSATVDQGIRFDWKVPDDYDSGDLTLSITYAMATADSGKAVIVLWKADIAKDGVAIDTASYPLANSTLSPANDTNPYRQTPAAGGGTAPVIDATDFAAGDTIQFFVGRNADDGGDTHLYAMQVLTFDISYTGQVATRDVVEHIQIFADTDETAPASGTKGNFETMDFSATVDNEQKFECMIPDNWDGMSDVHVRITYALDVGTGGNVVLETEGSIADISGNDIDAVTALKFNMPASADTSVHRSMIIRSLPASTVGAGDTVVLKLARRATDPDDTANADKLQVINAVVLTGVGPATGFEAIVVSESYLYSYDFGAISGSPTNEQIHPDPVTEKETWLKVTGNAPVDFTQVSFQGRLSLTQSEITQIKIPIKGTVTAGYRIYVYMDGDSGTAVYDSGAQTFPSTSRSLLTIVPGDAEWTGISEPTGEKRFFVLVNITVDAAEVGYVGFPFVKQE